MNVNEFKQMLIINHWSFEVDENLHNTSKYELIKIKKPNKEKHLLVKINPSGIGVYDVISIKIY